MSEGRYVFFRCAIIKVNHSNPLEGIQDEDPIDYGNIKHCKICNKRMNYINAKQSNYCHTCKDKAINKLDENKSADNYLRGDKK